MEGQDFPEADLGFHLADSGLPAPGRAQVVAGLEKMGGIETEAEPAGVLDSLINRGQMRDIVAQAGALASGVFQGDPHGRGARGAKDIVESGDDLLESGCFAGAKVGARAVSYTHL